MNWFKRIGNYYIERARINAEQSSLRAQQREEILKIYFADKEAGTGLYCVGPFGATHGVDGAGNLYLFTTKNWGHRGWEVSGNDDE